MDNRNGKKISAGKFKNGLLGRQMLRISIWWRIENNDHGVVPHTSMLFRNPFHRLMLQML
jgi:hypothetical protein